MSTYGYCTACGQLRSIRKDGTMRHHNGDWWIVGKATTCKGSGQKPKEAGR